MTRQAIVLAGITLLAFGLRVVGIESLGDLDFDEQASFFIASKPLGEMLAYLRAAPFEHPPLFYALFHVWLSVVGGTETAMRLFSVLLGTLTVPLVGVVASRAAGPRAGLAAAGVLAVLPLHVFHSRDARMYPLLGILSAIALAGLVMPRDDRGRRLGLAVALISGAAALATHYYAAFGVLGCIVGYVLFSRKMASGGPVTATLQENEVQARGHDGSRSAQLGHLSRGALVLATLGILGSVAAVLWVSLASGLQTSLSVVRPRAVAPLDLALSEAQSLGGALAGPLAPQGWFLVGAGLVGLVLLLGARAGVGSAGATGSTSPPHSRGLRGPARTSDNAPRNTSPSAQHSLGLQCPARPPDAPPRNAPPTLLRSLALWGYLVPTVAVPLLALLGRSFAPRFVALAIPCLAILVGLVAQRLPRRGVLLGGAVLAVGVLPGLVPMYGGYVRSDYGRALATLRAEARPDDAIVLNGPWQDILYRRYGQGLPHGTILASTVPLQAAEVTERLDRIAAAHPRVWVVDSATDAADPDGVVAGWLDAHAYARPVIPFEKALLRPYLTDHGRPALTDIRPTTVAGLGVRLERVALDAWTLRPGSEARIHVDGRLDPETGNRRLVARLVAPDGRTIWHADGALLPLRDGAVAYRAAVVVPDDATDGAHRLEGVVYEDVMRLDGSRMVGDVSEPLVLGTVELVGR